MASLLISNISKSYKTNNALRHVSLTLENGVFGLVGPNGSGKTTLLRILATTLEPSSGSIELDSVILSRRTLQLYRSKIGYLPQKNGLYPHMTSLEYLQFTASLKGIPTPSTKMLHKLLWELGVSSKQAAMPIGRLSGGTKQRIGIASAFIGNPHLILLDEPTAGLDPEERIRFRNLMETHTSSCIIIISTHITQDVELGCQKLGVLFEGTLIHQSSPQKLIQTVRGKTWEAVISKETYRSIREDLLITSAVNHGNQIRIHHVGPFKDIGETEISPTLEDAYVHLIHTITNKRKHP